MRHYGKLLGGVGLISNSKQESKTLLTTLLTILTIHNVYCIASYPICIYNMCSYQGCRKVSKMGGPSGRMGIKLRWPRLNLRNAVFQGLPPSDRGKIPCVFNIFLVFYFQPQNITFNLLPMHMERYTIINIHSKPHSHLQQSLLQNIHSIISLSDNLQICFRDKRLHHNPGTSFNF